MLQFLSPLALLALAALAVPAILHLWRPPATTIRVGTLKFFTGPAVRRLNRLRWRERLLLAVRLLLLTLLVLLLAQPVWRRQPSARPQKWALLEPGLTLSGDAEKRWNEVRAAGYEARALAAGFARVRPNESSHDARQVIDTWSLLRELDARLPSGSSPAVFSSDRLASLRGERPRMQQCAVEWVHDPAARDQTRVWMESLGRAMTGGELRVVIGRSNAETTEYVRLAVAAMIGKTALSPPLNGWSLELRAAENQHFRARLLRDGGKEDESRWVSATPPRQLRVALLAAAGRAEDARYVEAALRAVAETAGETVTFDADAATADWIIWLNDQPPPAEIVRAVTERGADLLSDAEGSDAVATPTTFGDPPVELSRRTTSKGDAGAAVWWDGFGVPLLTVKREGAGRHWHFFSRFHPDWNALPRSSALPAALRTILFAGEVRVEPTYDLRRADASQTAPGNGSQSPAIRLTAEAENVDLRDLIWFLCIALFIVERVLSHRRSKAQRDVQSAARAPDPEAALA